MKITYSDNKPKWTTAAYTTAGRFYRDEEDHLFYATSWTCVCLTDPGKSYGDKRAVTHKVKGVPEGTVITIEV